MCIQGSAGSDHILRLEMDDINGERRIGFHIETPFGEAAFLIILLHETGIVNGKTAKTGQNPRDGSQLCAKSNPREAVPIIVGRGRVSRPEWCVIETGVAGG